jgi:hypothetical protein
LVRIGGIPRMTRATVLLQKPTLSQAMRRPMIAMLGRARPSEETPSARKSPRWRCPSHRPSGMAIAIEIPSAVNASSESSADLFSSRPA